MYINLKKLVATVCVSTSLLLPGRSFADYYGEYTQNGYITYVKANDVGNYCFIGIGTSPSDRTFQKGFWYCGNVGGQNLLNLAKTAMVMQLPVSVIILGNGEETKPIHAISIESK